MKPTLEGKFGRAWDLSDTPHAKATTVGAFLIETAPRTFHPFWFQWMISVVHLRDVEGFLPAHKEYPDAEYEFMIVSVNPEHPTTAEEIIGGGALQYLLPVDVVVQFHGVSDDEAADLAKMAASAIVHHGFSPDQDFRSDWKETLWNSIEHVRTGGQHSEAHD